MRLIPLVLAVALFMENLDATVIATSLPQIAADIGSDPIALKLALTAYYVALAIFIPLSGWAADKFGSKRVLQAAIIVFMLGSIACAFSDSLLTFVLSRFLQGAGGSMMTPIARLVLVRRTTRSELVGAMAWLTIPALIGPVAGPPLGGFLTTYFSWHWIFWINIPIGIAGLLLIGRFLSADELRTPRPIDLPGLCLVAVAFAGLMFGFSVVSLPAIPAVAGYAAMAVGATALLVYLLWHVRRAEHPILNPAMFRYPLFRNAIIGTFLFRIAFGASPFLMPLMLQLAFGMNALDAGLVTFVSALGAILAKVLAEGALKRFGFRTTLIGTTLVATALTASFALFSPGGAIWVLMAFLFVLGVARSMFLTAANVLSFADVDDVNASQASTIHAVNQQISVAAGVAIAGAALETSRQLNSRELALDDFHTAWIVVSVVSALSLIVFLRLPRDAGRDVSGHRRPAAGTEDS